MARETISNISDFNSEVKLKGFKVYAVDVKAKNGHNYNRKDFYKISLNTGK
jgi:AraC family transcriptional regulator, transcriptional activator of pobA